MRFTSHASRHEFRLAIHAMVNAAKLSHSQVADHSSYTHFSRAYPCHSTELAEFARCRSLPAKTPIPLVSHGSCVLLSLGLTRDSGRSRILLFCRCPLCVYFAWYTAWSPLIMWGNFSPDPDTLFIPDGVLAYAPTRGFSPCTPHTGAISLSAYARGTN